MSKAFNPSGWINGVTIPKVADFQAIATDLYAKGANCDSGGYGMPNTGFVTLIPGALPGAAYTVTAASWATGSVTYTIGGHVIGPLQIVTISGASPSGYNIASGTVTGVTSTTITLALATNPGAWVSGGTVTVGTAPGNGTVAVNNSNQVQIYSTSTTSWGAATTAVAAGVWHSGSGAPSSGLGSNGDMYLNTSTGDVYGPKTAGAWGSIVENIKGATGSTGSTGSTGATGSAGYSPEYVVAAGAPGSGTGNNGDMYINSTTDDVYGPKTAGAWGSIACNIKGATGSTGSTGTSSVWRDGAGVPSSGLGNNGDMYLNTSTGDVYGPKTAGAWGSIAMNLVGPSGGVADPGGNGIMKRTALNTTAIAGPGDYPVFVASGSGHEPGVVPDPGATAGATRYLREDATWVAPSGSGPTVQSNANPWIATPTTSRALSTVYRNTGAKALNVSVVCNLAGAGSYYVQANSDASSTPSLEVALAQNLSSSGGITTVSQICFVVLPGNYYELVSNASGASVSTPLWVESQ